MSDLYFEPAHALHQKLVGKELSAVELASAVLDRLESTEATLNAYLLVTRDAALRAAEATDRRIAAGEAISYWDGIPVAVKDNMCTKGIRTTCASKILQNYVPPYTATAVGRLLEQGAVMVGKTNMDEFAFGSSTENSAFGPTRNPWDLERVPGGSSGGSAAAVAAGAAVAGLGSDTGGSVRQPASLCGIVGMKPTYGRVSRYGLVAFASSLDQISPVTRDVRDTAEMLKVICGHDPMDSTSSPDPVPDYAEALNSDIKGVKIGVPKELMGEGLQPVVRASIEAAVATLEELGAVCEEVSLPHVSHTIPAYYLIAPAEASSNLARFDGVRYGYRAERPEDALAMYKRSRGEGLGPEAKRRIMLGTYALSAGYYQAYYGQAQRVRTLIIRDFEAAFARYDVLISPASPSVAFRLGEKVDDPLQMYLSDICTAPANLAGIPAASLPCGLEDGLPVGLQVMARVLDEPAVLRVAYAFEQARGSLGAPPLN